jgi:hypothetical protein
MEAWKIKTRVRSSIKFTARRQFENSGGSTSVDTICRETEK